MEKYRVFSDAGTGLNPFLPPWSHNRSQNHLWQSVFYFLPRLFMLVIRLFLLITLFLWIVASNLFLSVLPLKYSEWMMRRHVNWLPLRVILFLLGFLTIKECIADFRRLKIKKPMQLSEFWSPIKRQSIVLSNFTSFIEILFLNMKLNPLFTILHSDGSLSPSSFFGALRHSFQFKVPVRPGKFRTLKALVNFMEIHYHGGVPIVIFPEGMKSNGLAMLNWKLQCFLDEENTNKQNDAIQLFKRYQLTLVAFSYFPEKAAKHFLAAYSPPHTVNYPITHVGLLCYQFCHNLNVSWFPAKEFLFNELQKSTMVKSLKLLRCIHSRMLTNAEMVDIDSDRLYDFYLYWRATQKKSYL
ncbi:1-acylglycerol-3-phosphate O-acyltransferase [Cardiosporidium cionae]|uniref:1-acylglycerol-3-phosphate O-acyltransferase n=1 Tax=Cardiosporidium cionae TaxID=476202 RepID=A0ABQ7J9Z9_9APIC|nr:1-acylglycerol-3-phosphate O-acyltransferase [Cardiosporidium cionae]|eukprot:KAF8820773.1 1-acylglycerol-3-phosphate O-acyltransferase [Cardiosporidium cionae]